MAPCRTQSPLYMKLLTYLSCLLVAAARCDVTRNPSKESIQFPFDVRIGAETSKEPIAVLLSQTSDSGRDRRSPGQSENSQQSGDSSEARHHSTSCEPDEPQPTPSPQHVNFTCTAQCPSCPSCPPARACPSPCAAIPPCPAPQACPTPCAACPACPTCKKHIPPGYEYFAGHGYYRLHNVPVVWMTAKETCEREGAHLAIINSQEEANLMKTLFSRDPDIGKWLYLGFHDLYKEGRYVTLFGQALAASGYTVWNPGQPDNHHNNENCGSMYLSGGLNDLDCSSKQPFVCELPV